MYFLELESYNVNEKGERCLKRKSAEIIFQFYKLFTNWSRVRILA